MMCTEVADDDKMLKIARKTVAADSIERRDGVLVCWRADAIQPDERAKTGDLNNRPKRRRVVYGQEVLGTRLIGTLELRIKLVNDFCKLWLARRMKRRWIAIA